MIFISITSYATEILNIKNIKISAAAKNATIARNLAIENGQVKAFYELVKLHYPAALNKIDKLNQTEIFNTIEGFELSEEKRSSTQYFAKMSVNFNDKNLTKIMNELGARYKEYTEPKSIEKDTETQIKPQTEVDTPRLNSLIIPVFEKDGQAYWFDDENTWLTFWQKKLLDSTDNQFTLPIGDLEDFSFLNKTMISKNIIDLAPLFERYNVNNIAILKLKIIDDMQGNNIALQVNYINRFNPSWQQHDFLNLQEEDLNSALLNYYTQLQDYKFNKTQDFINSLDTVAPKTITINFSIENLLSWIELEHNLSNVKFITNVELKEMNLKNYLFNLTYNIEFDNLQKLLLKHQLVLEDDGENNYTLIKEDS